jgi:hypothetical protein
MSNLPDEQAAMRERWRKRAVAEAAPARVKSIRFGRSDEILTAGWLERPGYTRSRFMAKVRGRRPEECWVWQAHLDRDGYGRFSMYGVGRAAHRVAYEATRGPVPEGLTLDHLCRNRACVNPLHLEAVSHKVNVNRVLAKWRDLEIVQKSSKIPLKYTPIGAEEGT